jgi:hypothetical protein
MRRLLARWTRFYGANPLHLLVLLGCFALTGYVAVLLAAEPLLTRMLVWFAAAIVVHDLALFPLYGVADRSLTGAVGIRQRRGARQLVSPVNYIRVPALGSALLFLLFFPGILEQGAPTYLAATGQTQAPFLGRWLLVTAGLFLASAVVYAARLGQAHRQARREQQPENTSERTTDG